MNILLVNEAGCFAPGIISLAKALSVNHRVVIVGPLNPQINSGHRFTVAEAPLRIRQYFVLNKVKIFSVTGTPCDCVTLALDKLLHSKPDVIISGIAERNNRGEMIYSSGVVQAAIEGSIQGIPSIAVSAHVNDPDDEKSFTAISSMIAKHLNFFISHLNKRITLNVNFPEKWHSKKIVCTQLTCDMIENSYTEQVNPFGNTFYWLKQNELGYSLNSLEQKGDLYWLKHDYITVTPLKLNLTNDEAIQIVQESGVAL